MAERINGTVKYFNGTKGYGFITQDSDNTDVFVHMSAVEAAGLNQVSEGQRISFVLVTNANGKTSASELQAIT